jgi:hypothetical protein
MTPTPRLAPCEENPGLIYTQKRMYVISKVATAGYDTYAKACAVVRRTPELSDYTHQRICVISKVVTARYGTYAQACAVVRRIRN